MNRVLLLPVAGFALGLLTLATAIRPVNAMGIGSGCLVMFCNVAAFVFVWRAQRQLKLSAKAAEKRLRELEGDIRIHSDGSYSGPRVPPGGGPGIM